MHTTPPMIKVFYSYCHDEELQLAELRKQVAPIVRDSDITEWYDRLIPAGHNLDTILKNINDADVIILLLSPGYLASDSCMSEITIAWERAEMEGLEILPVVTKRCAWKDNTTLSKHLLLPTDGRPIDEWQYQGQAWEVVRQHLKLSIQIQRRRKEQTHTADANFRLGVSELSFVQQENRTLRIDDVFVLPNILLVRGTEERQLKNLRDVLPVGEPTILRGPEQSGKSTVARKIWLNAWSSGNGALIVDGQDMRKGNPQQTVRRAFEHQINGDWRQWIEKDNTILIVDNAGVGWSPRFASYVEETFSSVLYTMTNDEYLAEVRNHSSLTTYRCLRLGTLTHSQQEELIQRWLGNRQDKRDIQGRHQRIDELEDHINAIIDKNRVVPRYPFFVLSILQTRELFMPQDLQITAYAHCYRALVIAHLCKAGILPVDLDGAINLLAELAFSMFLNGREKRATEEDSFLEQYTRDYVLNRRMYRKLRDSAIVLRVDSQGHMQFTHKFSYYYFLGQSLAQRYDECSEIIDDLATTIYRPEDAHILLFLLHHSRSTDLLETLLLHSMEALEDLPIATLDVKEVSPLSEALKAFPRSLPATSVKRERKIEREARDVAENREVQAIESDGEYFAGNVVYKALRHMEILGQVLRNQYGSMPKNKLVDVVETIVDSGLKLTHMFISDEFLRGEEDDIRGNVARSLEREAKRKGSSKPKKERIDRETARLLGTISIMVVLSLVGRTVTAIWRRELVELVREVCAKSADPAHALVGTVFEIVTRESVSRRDAVLVKNLHERLEDEGNFVVARIFSLLVQHHLRTHDGPVGVRQRIVQTLRIEMGASWRSPLV